MNSYEAPSTLAEAADKPRNGIITQLAKKVTALTARLKPANTEVDRGPIILAEGDTPHIEIPPGIADKYLRDLDLSSFR
jgi:hypothetical protein